MSKDNFYKNSMLLTVSNLTTGILRFMFAIVLSRKLGSEGLGLYFLILPVYDLFCCLICGGMITAISKEASVYFNKRDYANLNKSVRGALVFDLIWAVIIAGLVFALSPFISQTFIKDGRAIYSLWLICPALVFVALSSIIKGYFYGISNMKLPAIIDIFEKTVRMGVIMGLITILSLKNVTATVTATYAALAIGELLSFIILYFFFNLNQRKLNENSSTYVPRKLESKGQLLFDVLAVSSPLCINGFLTTALATVSTLLIPRRLVQVGMQYTEALELIGKFTGMALTIVFFPMIIIMSISIVLIPDISKSLSQNDYYTLEKRVKEVLKISLLLGISTLVICISIPTALGELFFSRSDLTEYIKMAAWCAPASYLAASTFGILNGLGKQKVILRNSIITAVEQLVLFYVLIGIPGINIYGYGIGFIITSLTGFAMNMYEIQKHCYVEYSIGEVFIDVCLGGLLFYVLKIFDRTIPVSMNTFKCILIIIFGFAVFFFSAAIVTKAEEG